MPQSRVLTTRVHAVDGDVETGIDTRPGATSSGGGNGGGAVAAPSAGIRLPASRWKRVTIVAVLLVAMVAAVLFQIGRVSGSDGGSHGHGGSLDSSTGGASDPSMSGTSPKGTLVRLPATRPTPEQLEFRAKVGAAFSGGVVSITQAYSQISAKRGHGLGLEEFCEALEDAIHVNLLFEQDELLDVAPVPLRPVLAALQEGSSRVDINSTVLFPAIFRWLDTNGDAILTPAELSHTLAPFRNGVNPNDALALVFQLVDANGDGKIDRNQELVPMIVDIVKLPVSVADQFVDVATGLVDAEGSTLITLAGLALNHPWSKSDIYSLLSRGFAFQNYYKLYIAAGLQTALGAVGQAQQMQAVADGSGDGVADGSGDGVAQPADPVDPATMFQASVDKGLAALANVRTQMSGMTLQEGDLVQLLLDNGKTFSASIPDAQTVGKDLQTILKHYVPTMAASLYPTSPLNTVPEAAAMNVSTFLNVLAQDGPIVAASIFKLLDCNADGSLTGVELNGWLDLVQAFMPTPADVSAATNFAVKYAKLVAKFKLAQAQGVQPHFSDDELPVVPVEDKENVGTTALGRLVSALFALIDANEDQTVGHDEMYDFVKRLMMAIGDVTHMGIDVFTEVELEPVVHGLLWVLWPPALTQATSGPNSMTLSDMMGAVNLLMNPTTTKYARPSY